MSFDFTREKQALVEERSEYAFRDRIKTLMKLGKPPLGSEYLEDPTKTNYMIVKIARSRGEIPRLER